MNPCWLKPCKNGGSCQSKGLNYKCICKSSSYGNNCQYIKNSTILDTTGMRKLKTLLGSPLDSEWKLLYRSSRDGVLSNSFHAKCSNVSGTLILIKTTNSNIFGGYTAAEWSGTGFKYDPTAYMFSLVNSYKLAVKMSIISKQEAIYCNPTYGIIFGGAGDLSCDHYGYCFSNLGYSYQLPNYLKAGSAQARTFLAGSYSFHPVEIEVYWIDRIIRHKLFISNQNFLLILSTFILKRVPGRFVKMAVFVH